MPVIKSAKKQLEKSREAESRNNHFKLLAKNAIKTVKKLLTEGKMKEAEQALIEAYSKVDTLVKKNIIHKNNAARKKASIAKSVSKQGKKA